ncbi:stage II sporulation protein P [Cohnella hongkongensis]|uniref:Stage II sporulation protein P n=1 Tax=Cohnella hongkongensis TaxID=178337 RepID=A0ABV9FIL7_9BACL
MFPRKFAVSAAVVVLLLFVSFASAYGEDRSAGSAADADSAGEKAVVANPDASGSVVKIVDVTNLRSGPGLDHQIVGKAVPGVTLPIVDEEGDWYVVALPSGEQAYVANWVVETATPVRYAVFLENTNLRAGPGLEYEIVGKAAPGERWPIESVEGDWYLVALPDGERAYVASWVVDTELDDGKMPAVYIYHTHNRESWKDVARHKSGSSVDDPEVNITLVGQHLGERLQQAGIQTLVETVDFAERLKIQKLGFSQSYEESRKAVTQAMNAYPTLAYFFDIHRDADVPRKQTTVTIKGKSYARILFVIGTAHPDSAANKKLAEELNKRLNKKYPGLSRGIISKSAHQGNGEYNQSLSPGSLLLEVGGANNTLEESRRAAEAFADVFSEYYQATKKK